MQSLRSALSTAAPNRLSTDGKASSHPLNPPGVPEQALHAEVTSFETRVCSEGQVAITVVLHDIKYATARDDRPSSLAIKMHPADAGTRSFGYQAGMFSQELWFYSKFRAMCPSVEVRNFRRHPNGVFFVVVKMPTYHAFCAGPGGVRHLV